MRQQLDSLLLATDVCIRAQINSKFNFTPFTDSLSGYSKGLIHVTGAMNYVDDTSLAPASGGVWRCLRWWSTMKSMGGDQRSMGGGIRRVRDTRTVCRKLSWLTIR